MELIYLLLPFCLLLGAGAVAAFWWAVRSGQFDDLSTPAWRILFDDDAPSGSPPTPPPKPPLDGPAPAPGTRPLRP